MGNLSKKLVSIVTSIAISSGLFLSSAPIYTQAATTETAVTASNSSSSLQADKIEDGVILHAWCWSFNEIKNHVKEIADAGYTSIQTSPAQACRKGESWNDTSLKNTKDNPTWYYHYQPTYYTLGNYQLGTAAEFKAMCEAAHEYGLKIIVDIVGNHLADIKGSTSGYVDSELASHVHHAGTITNWSNRYQVTQGNVIGMPDLDTGNSVVQNKMINYLNELADAGADGFRFDAAKSIELPEETASGAVTSTYWTNIIKAIKSKNPNAFIYGEVLQGDEPGTNFPGYAKYMNVTASTYGWYVRSAVGYEVWENGTLDGNNNHTGKVTPTVSKGLVDKYMEGQVGDGSISNSKLVSFVETHDTYANEGATRCLSQNQIQLAWAMVAGREGSVPLFFNRPTSQSFGDDYIHPQGEPYKDVGQSGSDDYKQQNVVEMNKFHTLMEESNVGESVEAINNNNIMKISRENLGLVLVNVSTSSQSVSTSTNLPDGTYTNKATYGGTFTVSNGKITGNLPASSFAVLYKAEEPITVPTPTISQEGGDFTGDSLTVTVGLKNATSGTVKVGSKAAEKFTSSKQVVIGEDLAEGESVTVVLTATDGKDTTTKKYTFTKKPTPVLTDDVYCQLPSGWGSTLYCYAYNSTGNLAKWPGNKMNNLGNGLYSYDLPDGWEGYIIFTDGNSNQYPGSGLQGLTYTAGSCYKYENGKWEEYNKALTLSSLNASATDVDVATEVTFTAAVSGGTAPYTYKYTVSKDGASAVSMGTSTDGTIKWTPSKAGTYTIKLEVTDKAGAKVSKTVEVTARVNEEKPCIDSVTGVESNGNITYTVKASGGKIGTNLLFYKFYIIDSKGNATVGQNYSTNNTFTTTSTNKKIRVEVENSMNDKVSQDYEYTGETPSKLDLTIATNVSSPRKVNETIKITGKATGAQGDALYRFVVNMNGKNTVVLQDYKTNNTVSWKPSKAGTYTIYGKVKDDNGKVVTKTMKFTIKSNDVEDKIVEAGVKDGSNLTVNGKVNFFINAQSASAIQYKYVVQDTSTSKYAFYKEFSSAKEATWTPTKAGTYKVYLRVKYASGKTDVVTKNVTIKSVSQSTLKITSNKVNLASPQPAGSLLILTMAAKGGNGDLTYRFVVQKGGKNVFVQNYTSNSRAIWVPSEAGTYKIYYKVKDASGKVVQKSMSYVIK